MGPLSYSPAGGGNASLPAGWGWPALSKRAHWFDAGNLQALCGKWLYSGERTPPTDKFGPDDCAACKRKLETRRKKES